MKEYVRESLMKRKYYVKVSMSLGFGIKSSNFFDFDVLAAKQRILEALRDMKNIKKN